MKLTELVTTCYENSGAKGWHDKKRSPLEFHALFMSEIAEALEEVRNKKSPLYEVQDENGFMQPRGEAVELADVIIRIADYFGYKKWDLNTAIKKKLKYNMTRGYREGNKEY